MLVHARELKRFTFLHVKTYLCLSEKGVQDKNLIALQRNLFGMAQDVAPQRGDIL
jgi:hypothetical protein